MVTHVAGETRARFKLARRTRRGDADEETARRSEELQVKTWDELQAKTWKYTNKVTYDVAAS